MNSLLSQSYTNYEILCYHDGPLLDARLPMAVPVRCTSCRYNDYGHTLRNLGIHEAQGDYIIHFNPDNVLYDNALEEIHKAVVRDSIIFDENNVCLDTNNIIIFPILMRGVQIAPGRICRFDDRPDLYTIFSGVPVKKYNIDCLQFVMKTSLWIESGGWFDKSHDGDGNMYEQFAKTYGYRTVAPVLGEHF